MKIWIDDVRPAPEGYARCKTVEDAMALIGTGKTNDEEVCISMDHDAGDYRSCGGDYIEILNRLDEMCGTDRDWKNWVSTKVTFHIHSMNPVGVQNMRRIIQRNGWTEKQ